MIAMDEWCHPWGRRCHAGTVEWWVTGQRGGTKEDPNEKGKAEKGIGGRDGSKEGAEKTG